MAVLCDGMSGLDKGELVSATIIRVFSEWFENELPKQIDRFSLKKIVDDLVKLDKRKNYLIGQSI